MEHQQYPTAAGVHRSLQTETVQKRMLFSMNIDESRWIFQRGNGRLSILDSRQRFEAQTDSQHSDPTLTFQLTEATTAVPRVDLMPYAGMSTPC